MKDQIKQIEEKTESGLGEIRTQRDNALRKLSKLLSGVEKAINAQSLRQMAMRLGFSPLCKINNAESWVKNKTRIIIYYKGEYPERVKGRLQTFRHKSC